MTSFKCDRCKKTIEGFWTRRTGDQTFYYNGVDYTDEHFIEKDNYIAFECPKCQIELAFSEKEADKYIEENKVNE